MFTFEILRFKGKLNGYVPLNSLIPNFMAFFVVTGMGLSLISCISSVESSPNLLFFNQYFADGTWLPTKKCYAKAHLSH